MVVYLYAVAIEVMKQVLLASLNKAVNVMGEGRFYISTYTWLAVYTFGVTVIS